MWCGCRCNIQTASISQPAACLWTLSGYSRVALAGDITSVTCKASALHCTVCLRRVAGGTALAEPHLDAQVLDPSSRVCLQHLFEA